MKNLLLGPDDDLVVLTVPAGTSLLVGDVEVQFRRHVKGAGSVLAIRKPKTVRVVRNKRSSTC